MIRINDRRLAAALAVAGLTLATIAGRAWAGKPGGGGGGSGPVDTGTIYFTAWNGTGHQFHSMNPDGTGKTALPVTYTWVQNYNLDGANVQADVSRTLHNGHRWFLQLLAVPNEPKINGDTNWEIGAFRDDGVIVRLTYSSPDFKGGRPRWSPGDTRIAFQGGRWDPSRGTSGMFWPEGFFVADVVYDPSGNVVGLASTPTAPAVASTVYNTVGDCDWSPDGTRLVFPLDQGSPLVIANVSDGSMSVVSGTASQPRMPQWSPDGQWIAYFAAGDVRKVHPDGTGDTLVLQHVNGNKNTYTYYGPAFWSPGSVNLLLDAQTPGRTSDVARALPSGGTVTKLTSDLNVWVFPLRWR